jgi:hypothetical protein
MSDNKPLNWSPQPGVGMNVTRRTDGGMNLTFTDTSEATLQAWHDFALEHLLGSDRLKRNLYDLRAVRDISEKAVRTAVEVNSDPSARNIRLAVVVGEAAAKTVARSRRWHCRRPAAVKIFYLTWSEAEAWPRPLDQMPDERSL